ncbi:MAG: molybdenum cofactor biosynthesis protein MoaA [Planctomycetaceae bacterium]|jgi:hypothetical protein|nr:molybdenum cofactor biosynthesis protein MoaA [Planctomycetaceae bacterium]MDP7278012.1 radical SAM protein [Planctomycetaceae bacterium]
MSTTFRDHTFLGMTQSLCPECLSLVPAKIIERGGRVYFRKHCPTHGSREDFICNDVNSYDRLEFSVPGRIPQQVGVTSTGKGCPYECGLCTEHEQHTCVGLVELTDSCNLSCPMCYASSGPGGRHLSLQESRQAIDRLVEVEGRPEVLQLSGGEPTIHPEFLEILDYACGQPIDIVMINTNGIRFAHDPKFLEAVAAYRHRLEIYLQFDGFRDTTYEALRGEALVETKQLAVEALGALGLRTTLVTTVQPGVNEDELGAIVEYGLKRSWVTGISLQPATYSGRHVLPEMIENRITFPEVVSLIESQTNGLFTADDFMPLPCAHPNCHTLSYAYRSGDRAIPLLRFIDARHNTDLLANGITFNRPRARELIETYLGRLGCCGPEGCGTPSSSSAPVADLQLPLLTDEPIVPAGDDSLPLEFFQRALAEDLDPEDVFRITITSFLDAYNFDVRRVMKCCIHHVLPSGHVVPFCAYNVLYREGHVPLPTLDRLAELAAVASP